jgi:GT2 family glycosyltransferase
LAPIRVAVLVTCHNRVQITMRGLTALVDALEGVPQLECDLFVVDDGSRDGTGAAVIARFPQAHVRTGNGSLYWNGGMVAAFQPATRVGLHDAYLLFNDDVVVKPCQVRRFFEAFLQTTPQQILVGATTGDDGKTPTYGGFRQTSAWRALSFERVWPSEDGITACDTFNANFVAIPGDVLRQINGPDPKYQHALGDMDLGLTARDSGVASGVFGEFIGVCEKGETVEKRIADQRFRRRIFWAFVHPFGIRPYLHFCWKHRPKILLPLYAVGTIYHRARLVIAAKRRSEGL